MEHFKRKMVVSFINRGPHSGKVTKCNFQQFSLILIGALPNMTVLKIEDIIVNPEYLYRGVDAS